MKSLLEVLSAAGNGSSKPFNLFKQTSVQDPGLPPPTTAFPGLRIDSGTRLITAVDRLLQDRHD
jgi:hypothetical protein